MPLARAETAGIPNMTDDHLEQYRSALLLLARAQLGRQKLDILDASDLVNQTLLEAYQNRERLTGRAEEEKFAWLRKNSSCGTRS